MGRSKNEISRIRSELRKEGFDKVNTVSDEIIGRRPFPSLSEIKFAIKMAKESNYLKELPFTIKKLQKYGMAVPVQLEQKIATQRKKRSTRKKNKGLDPRTPYEKSDKEADTDLLDSLKDVDYTTAEETTWTDYMDAAKSDFDPDNVTVNGFTTSVDEMKEDLKTVFDEEYKDKPNGVRFEQELDALYDEVFFDFDDAQIIALYGLMVTGQLFADFTDYDSRGDGHNVKGLYTLKSDIALARSAT